MPFTCEVLTDTSGNACTYLEGWYCTAKGACSTYSFSGYLPSAMTSKCSAAKTTDTYGCTFWPHSSTTNCTSVGACSSYTGNSGQALTDCATVQDTNGFVCTADSDSSTDCRSVANCEAILSPTS